MKPEAKTEQAPWTPPFCTIVGADTENLAYRACSLCERALPDLGGPCSLCSLRTPSPPVKLLYRLLLSIATFDRVLVVVSFDRAARTLLGCPAHEFLQFCSAHPGAARKAGQLLEGEMCRMTLKASKKGNAEHLRVVSVEPLRTGFRPIIHSLREIYSNGGNS
ncbi:Replication factor-A C terminal domain-containing protein [Carex littledalei]|uniref:Replication factor-A C terminal domain-containing protein n=1 Tax=Carex littledalei TaxID=544730 RepID=A0A833QLS1_9POAL|nr:Replication factor-A C terminal domain-containing protein [Carex littledalei]